MRGVLYLGTRSCPNALEEALRDHHGPITVLVPADPGLLAPHQDETIEDGYREVARLLKDRALQRALRLARGNQRALADVFGKDPPDPRERIQARVLDAPLPETLSKEVQAHEMESLFAGRDALDVLEGALQGLREEDGELDLITV